MASSVQVVPILAVAGPAQAPVPFPHPPSEGPRCPWAHIAASPPRPVNLSEIMSEQLADRIHGEEEEKYLKEILSSSDEDDNKEFVLPTELDLSGILSNTDTVTPTVDCSSDEVIATMLQIQFNKEYDLNLKKVEQKYNGSSKISVSLSNYMASSPRVQAQPDDSESEEEDDQLGPKSKKPWDSFEANERAFPAMSSRGYVKVNNKVVTKHDVTMNGRRNACKVMESFPPCIHTGDGASFDMQLSNKVYNNLKSYSKAEENRRTRMHDKIEKSTSDMAIDTKTKLMLYKLINNGILSKVYGIVATGKESVVMFGTGGNTVETEKGLKVVVPEECALKVFKTSLNEFKTREKYIKDDYRFKDRFSKQNPQKIIRMWAEKEMHNLTRMRKAEIPCPEVVLLKKHILILGFIGKDMRPAPKLKDVKFPQDDENALLLSAYNQTIDGMTNLYKRCNLIHGDLSEYNILWHENTCYFIDVSQSVEPAHPNALEFLYRDCSNICTFFSKRRLDNIHTPESLFTEISGFELRDVNGPAVLDKIRSFEKNVEQLTFATSEKSYPFEYCWDQEQADEDDE